MSLKTFLDVFSSGTGAAGTTIARSGFGFQPKAIIVWGSGSTATTDTTGRARIQPGFGFAVSTSNRMAICGQATNSATTTATDRGLRNDAIFATLSTAGAIDGLLDIQSFDSDGITFVVDDAFPSSYRLHCFAIGGTDITNANIVEFIDLNTGSSGTMDVTGLGFDDVDAIVTFGQMNNVAPSAVAAIMSMTVGVAAWNGSSFDNGVIAFRSRNGVTTSNTGTYCVSGDVLGVSATSATADLLVRAAVTSRITDGFQLTYPISDSGGTGRRNYALCLKGGRHKVGALTTQTDLVTPITVSGLPFQSRGGFFLSAGNAANTPPTPTANTKWSVGAFDQNSNAGTQGVTDRNGVTTTNTCRTVSHDSVYQNILPSADTVQGEAQLQSINSDGFSLIMSVADPAGENLIYWTMGDSAVPTPGPWYYYPQPTLNV